MQAIKHISFDLDGTLVDSLPIMKIAWEASMSALNLNCNFADYRKYTGLPFPKILELLDLSEYEKDLSEIYFSHTKKLSHEVTAFDGVNDVLTWAKEADISTSIITSKPRENSEHLCESLKFQIDMLICGDDHQYGKPNPAIAQEVLEAFNLSPRDVLYIGDMAVDYQFSLNVGMSFIFFDAEGMNALPNNLINPVESISCIKEVVTRLSDQIIISGNSQKK